MLISSSRRSPSPAVTTPCSASPTRRSIAGELVEPELGAERRRELEHDRLTRSHRHHEVRGEGADARCVDPEGASHLDEPLLDDRRRLPHLTHRRPEPDDERQDVGILHLVASGLSPVDRPPQRPLLRAVELLAGEKPLSISSARAWICATGSMNMAAPAVSSARNVDGGRDSRPGRCARTGSMSRHVRAPHDPALAWTPTRRATREREFETVRRDPLARDDPATDAACCPIEDAAQRSSVTSTSPADRGGRASAARRMSWADSSAVQMYEGNEVG